MNNKRPALELKEFLPYRINLLAKRIAMSLSSIYTKEFGITIPEWRVLLWLNSYDDLYAKDLIAYTFMDKTQVSRLVNQLEQRGLIKRELDRNDHRSFLLSLTEEGQTLIDKIIPKAIDWENQFIETLKANEYKALLNSVEKLERRLDALMAEDDNPVE